MSQSRVLAVDDERFFREVINDTLSAAGLEVITAATGAEALEAAADPAIGAVVLDLQLPDLHGLEVFRRLKETRPDLRVVILSAHTDEAHVLEALRLGAFDYLAKPLHEEELVLAVRRALDTHGLASGWQRLRSRVERLQDSLQELWSQARSDGVSPDDLRALAVRAVAEVLGAARTSLLLLDEDAAELKVVAALGNKVPTAQMDAVPVGKGVAGLALARGEPLLVGDVAGDARFAGREAPGTYATGSFAVAPLVAGARALGVLCATERTSGEHFDAEDLALMRILAVQIAQMIAPPTVSAPGAEPELEVDVDLDASAPLAAPAAPESGFASRGAELARAICEAVTSEVEPARILEAALKPVASALRAAPVSIYLRDPDTGDLLREAECDGGRRSDRPHIAATRGLVGSALATGQLVASGDPTSHPRFDLRVDTPADGRPGPLVCGALRFRGKPIGVFRAFPENGADAAPELAELIGSALSAAVRNVLLYRSLVQTIEEVAEARRAAAQS